MKEKKAHVVVVGGGFGGLNAALRFAKQPVEVTLVDRSNHHLFQPLLYQVATGGLNPSDIAYPIRAVVRRHKHIKVLLAEVKAVDRENRILELDDGELAYDYLIIATGATHSYFGNESWSAFAPGLKSINDALDIRKRIFFAYEAAEREQDSNIRSEWLTFVVVGAGPTGVELAGALAEIGHHTLAQDFRYIDPRQVKVYLIEGAGRVLPPYPESLSTKAEAALKSVGVEVIKGSRVTLIEEDGVFLGENKIAARTVLWAAGVQASPLVSMLDHEVDGAGRVKVAPDLSLAKDPRVFVIGDCAAALSEGKPVPGVAQGAVQGGRLAADNIMRRISGHETKEFRYVDKGNLATIGRAAAVADLGKVKFSGYLAWVFWWLVHIAVLVGFRNRVFVLVSWIWSYLTFARGARLIVGRVGKLPYFKKKK